MAPRRSAQTPAAPPQDQTPTAGTPEQAAPAEFTWDALAAPVAMPVKAGVPNITVKVLESVAEVIRKRAEDSLAINTKQVAAKAGSTASRNRVNYRWDVQPVPTVEIGAKFVKEITKYAKYRPDHRDIPHAAEGVAAGQVTARCGEPTYFVTGDDGIPVAADQTAEGAFLGVRYSVRPFEKRETAARLPGTA